MIKRIRRLWWLILAWLVAISGRDFWEFNVMELFATIAFLIGISIAIGKWWGERSRRNKRPNEF